MTAITSRRKAAEDPPGGGELAALRAEVEQLRADRWLLARGLAHLMVAVAPGHAPATFLQIATQPMGPYTHGQAARLEQILTGGPGGLT